MANPFSIYTRVTLADVVVAAHLLERLDDAFRCLVVDEARLDVPTTSSGVVTKPMAGTQAILAGPHGTLVLYPFDAGPRRFTIGRSSGADVVIRDVRISKEHCALGPVEGRSLWLTDLSSSNGTFVGKRCLAPGEGGRHLIAPGDGFALGQVALELLDRDRLRALVATVAL